MNENIKLYCGDCLNIMKEIPDNSIDLILTSPPYNIGKDYEKKLPIKEYFNIQRLIIIECVRVLQKDGSICWQVGNYVNKGEIIPIDMLLYPIFLELDLKIRNRIVWHFGHGLHATKRLSGRYEVLVWLTKSDNYFFNLDTIRIPQKYPNKKHYKGKKKGQLSCNLLGKNPSDVWSISNVKANHPEKTIHPAQFPTELVKRCVLSMSNEKDNIMDPFMGVGTTGIVCKNYNRKFIGIEKNEKYFNIAKQRIFDETTIF